MIHCYLLLAGDFAAEGRGVADVAADWGMAPGAVLAECRRISIALGLPWKEPK
jgi:hypothetical protein